MTPEEKYNYILERNRRNCKASYDRKVAKGLVEVSVWVKAEHRQTIKELAKDLQK